MSTPTQSERGRQVARVQEIMAKEGLSQRKACAAVGITEQNFRYHRDKPQTPAPAPTEASGVRQEGDDLAITDKATSKQVDADALLKKHGYDADDWIVTSIRLAEWGNPDEPQFQHRINATRKDLAFQIPEADFEPFEFGQIEEPMDRTVALIPDLHAPYCNYRAIGAVLDFLRAENPAEVIFLGDAGDHARLSKHRKHPRFNALLNATNDAVVQNFRRFREALPDAKMTFLPGNHDDRILYYSREVGGELEDVRPGKLWPDEPDPVASLNFRRLYQLDHLGIELVDEDWKLAKMSITPELSARHGYLTGNNAERKALEKHGRSQVHGHTHRGSLTYRTKHDPLDIRVSMDCGTLSEVNELGLGYEPEPDWTPGIGWCNVWQDGLFSLSFIPFIKDKLLTPWGMAFEGKEVA